MYLRLIATTTIESNYKFKYMKYPRYKNLQSLWQSQECEMVERASNEIAAMLIAMGVPPGTFYDFPKQHAKFLSVKYFRSDSIWYLLGKDGYTIAILYPTGMEGVLSVNYREVNDVQTMLELHYVLRTEYNRFIKSHQ